MRHSTYDLVLLGFSIIYNLLLSVISLLWLFTGVLEGWKSLLLSADAEVAGVQKALFAFFASGLLGGTFYCLRTIYQKLSDAYVTTGVEQKANPIEPKSVFNIKVWFFWFLFRPFQAGVLSIVVICLFGSNFLSMNNLKIENLGQLYYQVGLGFLIGFGTHEVFNKIEEIISILFAKGRNQSEQSTRNKPDGGMIP